MTKERRNKLMFRWSIFTAGAIALFWTIWYLVAGEVPFVDRIRWTESTYIDLPFTVSRWFDVLLAPVYAILGVSLVYFIQNLENKKSHREREDLAVGLALGLGIGLAFGLMAVPSSGLVAALMAGLVFYLIIGLLTQLVTELELYLVIGLGFCLGFGLGFGMGLGLGIGLGIGLGVGLGFVLVVSLAHLLKKLKSAFIGVKNWLAVK